MIDFKTGAESPVHRDQLRLYALLWERDALANPRCLEIDSLTVAYHGHDMSVEVPSAAELRELAAEIASQVKRADAELQSGAPTPIPSATTCRFCGVRQVCGVYWKCVAPKPSDVEVAAWFDYEGKIGNQNGPRSWWVMDPKGDQRELLLRTTSATQRLREGDRVRLLGLLRSADPEVALPLATLTSTSEIFPVLD